MPTKPTKPRSRSWILAALVAVAPACAIDEGPDPTADALDPTLDVDPSVQIVQPFDPVLRWVLHARPGFARLHRPDANGNLQLVREVPAGAVQWRAVAVAGDRLLWQSTVTGQLSLFRLDANANVVSFRLINAPAGLLARGLAVEQDATCPMPADGALTYQILLERPGSLTVPFEPPQVLRVDSSGVALGPPTALPVTYAFSTVREFRRVGGDFFGLVFQSNADPEAGGISYFLRRVDGSFHFIMTTYFSATAGLTGCTTTGPACPTGIVGGAPGPGYRLASIGHGAVVGFPGVPIDPGPFALWARPNDGRAQAFLVRPGSAMGVLPTFLDDPANANTGVSLAMASITSCGLVEPFTPPPGWPTNPPLD
jgi:hypothetical protein